MKRFLTLLAAVGTLLFTTTACDSDDPVAVTGIELDETTLSLVRGTSYKLTATVAPADAEDPTVKWESADPAIATVDAGNVTAVKVGQTTVRVVAVNGVSASCKVTVLPVEVASVTLDKTALPLLVGASAQLTATVQPADAEDPTVKWETSDVKVATVENGLVKAVSVGEAVVTAKAGGQSATCKVTVSPVPVESVTLDKMALTLEIGASETLTATVAPDNATDKSVTWSSSDAKVATVEGGVVRAVAAGTAQITAKAGEATASCTVTVEAPAAKTYAVGDLYDTDGVKGVVCWVDENGTSGKLISLDGGVYGEGMCWSTEIPLSVGAFDRQDGKANTAKIMAMGKPAGTFPACEWCVAKGEGWYLPAVEEVKLFFENFDKINPTLKANGNQFLKNLPYWSSTEDESSEGYAAFYVELWGEGAEVDKDDIDEVVRAMYAFGPK